MGVQAPTEFRLCRAGETVTAKCRFVFDRKSAEDVMRHYADRSVPIMGDIDFQSMNERHPLEAPRTITSARPEIRANATGEPELWAVDVRWSDRGRGMVQSRDYKYCVPAFVLEVGGRVTRLVGLALTNTPADPTIEPLMPDVP